MHQWVVGGAVIEAEVIESVAPDSGVTHHRARDSGVTRGGLLLVENHRRGGRVDWTPPGGVIDRGESVVEGLTREVAEETGLAVTRWEGPLYEISAEAPGLGWHLRVEVHRAVEVTGSVRTGDDPDGIVIAADVVPVTQCESRLCDAHPWVREPLLDWMAHRWTGSRLYRYTVDGTDPADLRIARHHG